MGYFFGDSMSTVNIALKMPNGLVAEVQGKKITFNGWHDNLIKGAEFGVTEDVPKEFWEAWKEENKNMPLVKNGYIFAQEKQKNLKAEIKDNAGRKAGTEQLDPNKMGKDDEKE